MRTFTEKRSSNLKAIRTSLLNYLEVSNEKNCISTEDIMVTHAIYNIDKAIEALDFIKEVQQK